MANLNNGTPSNTGEAITTNTITLFNVNTSNVTKLNSMNYLMWSIQVNALLDGYELAGYLDDSIVIPPATTTLNVATTVNPEYTFWKRQDKLIYSALLEAISSPVQSLVSRATTSAQIWSTLASTAQTMD